GRQQGRFVRVRVDDLRVRHRGSVRIARRFLDVKITHAVRGRPTRGPHLRAACYGGVGGAYPPERSTMSSPVPVAWTTRLENARALDPLVRLVRPLSDAL